MDISVFLAIIVIVASVWFTFDSLRARELATARAREHCRSHGLQFLDGTVALKSIRLGRVRGSLSMRRTYHFDFAETHTVRRRGMIVMLGRTTEQLVLDPDVLET